IAQKFLERAPGTGLRCDIGWRESDRIYGKSWFEWISSCRATLGTESGATITDFDGSLQRRVEAHMLQHPEDDFWLVHRELLAPFEGNVRMNVVSPRVFEATALRTALVLFPGEYSGVLERDRHYIPLEKDFSNFNDVVERLRDLNHLRELTDRAYEEIAVSPQYSLRALIVQFDEIVDESFVGASRPRLKSRYYAAQGQQLITKTIRPSLRASTGYLGRHGKQGKLGRATATAILIGTDRCALGLLVSRLRLNSHAPSFGNLVADLLRLAYV